MIINCASIVYYLTRLPTARTKTRSSVPIVPSRICLSCTGVLTVPESGHIKVTVTLADHYSKVTTTEHIKVTLTHTELRTTATPTEVPMVPDPVSLEIIIHTPTGVEL